MPAIRPDQMHTWICTRYGGPEHVRLETRPVPEPAAGGVVIRVHACTVSAADARIRARRVPRGMGLIARLIFGWSAPRKGVLGTELAGDRRAPAF